MKSTKILIDLGDPKLIKLLKTEAQENETSINDIIVTSLEDYFKHKLENKVLAKASESAFIEWNNNLDTEYDNHKINDLK